jgi:competence protein ComEC
MLMGLESNFKHVLTRSAQHQTFDLTVCTSQKMAEYPDFYSVDANVISQPDQLSLRKVRLTIATSKIGQALMPGSCISGNFRLRQPLGFLTPGGFDSDRYFFSKHIDAKATLIDLNHVEWRPTFVQKSYASRVSEFSDPVAADLWSAIALGWSASLDADIKGVFSSNQLMHLFVISGMHIGFIAFFILNMLRFCFWPLSKYVVLSRGVLYAITLAFVTLYVALLGWPVPATRALIMFAVPVLLYWRAIKVNWLSVFIGATLLISLLQPEAWLSLGAWLSFSSVAVILALMRWGLLQVKNRLLKVVIFQCAMSLTVIPWAFMAGFPINPLAALLNLLVTPIVGLLLLPAAFLIWLAPWAWTIKLFEFLMTSLFWGLELTASYAFNTGWFEFSRVSLVVALFGFLLWWAHSREKLILSLFILTVIIVNSWQVRIQKSLPTVTFYDVGHGSAVLIEDAFGRWMVDTGGGYDFNNSFFQRDLDRQIAKLDYLIITHADSDHSMGAEYIRTHQKGIRVWSGQPTAFHDLDGQNSVNSCHQPIQLSPNLRFIPVPEQFQDSDNNCSCILVYETANDRMILTGDADKTVEYFLIQQYPEILPFDVVLLGHHGSGSSSSYDWLSANRGAIYVVSTGDRAKPAWPAPRIQQWFADSGEQLLSTAQKGTIRLVFEPDKIKVISWETAYRNRLIN